MAIEESPERIWRVETELRFVDLRAMITKPKQATAPISRRQCFPGDKSHPILDRNGKEHCQQFPSNPSLRLEAKASQTREERFQQSPLCYLLLCSFSFDSHSAQWLPWLAAMTSAILSDACLSLQSGPTAILVRHSLYLIQRSVWSVPPSTVPEIDNLIE